jgi:predicted RNA-binding Zn-ribbon protein involved in translation (DUF1610 family)
VAIPASPKFRVIYHEPICPQCGSQAITTEEVETGDGYTETAYLCTACGEAWPLACVTDWATPPSPPRRQEAGHETLRSPHPPTLQ